MSIHSGQENISQEEQ